MGVDRRSCCTSSAGLSDNVALVRPVGADRDVKVDARVVGGPYLQLVAAVVRADFRK